MTLDDGKLAQKINLHDHLFKWLIDDYLDEFFELFFPHIKTSTIRDRNKEFQQKLENEKAAVEADFFLTTEAEVEGHRSKIFIILELKSKKEDVREQISEYFAHAYGLEKKPIWAIVLFTDNAKWASGIQTKIPLAFSSKKGNTYLDIEVIKLKDHSAEKLSKHRLLLAKLLALKADDRGKSREDLIKEVYRAQTALKETLPTHIGLLIEKFVKAYSQLPVETVEKIKQEADMTVQFATITDYYEYLGEKRGEKRGKRLGERRGKKIGKREGEILGQIKVWQQLKDSGDVESVKCDAQLERLHKELKALEGNQ